MAWCLRMRLWLVVMVGCMLGWAMSGAVGSAIGGRLEGLGLLNPVSFSLASRRSLRFGCLVYVGILTGGVGTLAYTAA